VVIAYGCGNITLWVETTTIL